jgi:pimeloyl-ACP methyl ester carboxylesterase
MEDLANDLVGLLDCIGCGQTQLVGSSLEAMVGSALALGHAARPFSLTFMASQGVLPEEGITRARENIAETRTSGAGNRTTLAGQTDAMLRRLRHNSDEAANPEQVALLRRIIGETTAFGQARAYEAIFGMNYDGRLGEIRTPTLVLAGAQDASTPPARIQIYKDGIAGAKMEVLQKAGYFSNVEQPDAFNKALRIFLDGLGS